MGKKLFLEGGRIETRSGTDIIGTSRHRSAQSKSETRENQASTPTTTPNQQTSPVTEDTNRVRGRRLILV